MVAAAFGGATGAEVDDPFSSSGECTSGGRLLEAYGGHSKEGDAASFPGRPLQENSSEGEDGGAATVTGSSKHGKEGGGFGSSDSDTPRRGGHPPPPPPPPLQQQQQANSLPLKHRRQDVDEQDGDETEGGDEGGDVEALGKGKLPRPAANVECPRCSSSETKFCYYNNYNVKQPRYYCKACQRYWTAGGTLRNVPVGAGRRKSKSASKAKAAAAAAAAVAPHIAHGCDPTLAGLGPSAFSITHPRLVANGNPGAMGAHQPPCYLASPYAAQSTLRNLLDPASSFGNNLAGGPPAPTAHYAAAPQDTGSCWANPLCRALPGGLAGFEALRGMPPALVAAAAAAAANNNNAVLDGGGGSSGALPNSSGERFSQENGVHGRRVRLRRCSVDGNTPADAVRDGHDHGPTSFEQCATDSGLPSCQQQSQPSGGSGLTSLTSAHSDKSVPGGHKGSWADSTCELPQHRRQSSSSLSTAAPHLWGGSVSGTDGSSSGSGSGDMLERHGSGYNSHHHSQHHQGSHGALSTGDSHRLSGASSKQHHPPLYISTGTPHGGSSAAGSHQYHHQGSGASASAQAAQAVNAAAALQAQAAHVAQAVNVAAAAQAAAGTWGSPNQVSGYWPPQLWPTAPQYHGSSYGSSHHATPNYMAAAAAAAAAYGGASNFSPQPAWNPLADANAAAAAVALASSGHGGVGGHGAAAQPLGPDGVVGALSPSALAANALMALGSGSGGDFAARGGTPHLFGGGNASAGAAGGLWGNGGHAGGESHGAMKAAGLGGAMAWAGLPWPGTANFNSDEAGASPMGGGALQSRLLNSQLAGLQHSLRLHAGHGGEEGGAGKLSHHSSNASSGLSGASSGTALHHTGSKQHSRSFDTVM